MPVQEWLPWVVPSGASVLVTTFVLLMYRGKVVSKSEVDRIERLYSEMLDTYKQASKDDKITIEKMRASFDKLADSQRTTNSLIQGLGTAAELARTKATQSESP